MKFLSFLAIILSCVLASHAHASELKSPFDVAQARSNWFSTLKNDKKEFVCPTVPTPVVQFAGVSRYCKEDKTRSVVCPENEALYQKASKEIDDFNSTVVELANRYVKAKMPRPEVAQCALSHMASWAKAGAWAPDGVQNVPVGEYKRGISLGALAAAYQLFSSEPTLDASQKKAVEAWLKGLARPLIKYVDEGEKQGRGSALANHRYWEGLAVTHAGIATQDSSLFDWGVRAYAIGMSQVQDNGVLPLELKRAKKGFSYHLFALQPLVMLEEILRVNGYETNSPELHGKMKKLVALVTPMIQDAATENSIFEYKDPYASIKDNQLAWLEIYTKNYADVSINPVLPSQLAILQDRRSKDDLALHSTMAGGDMTFFFGKP